MTRAGIGAADFLTVKREAQGMLDPGVYRAIAEDAARAENDIVEIGTLYGASAVAMALGAREGVRVKSVDSFASLAWRSLGGPDFASVQVRATFDKLGVGDRIDLFVGYSTAFAASLAPETRLGMLMLDADGAIDRDLALFYNRLSPGAPIVIDDCADVPARVTLGLSGAGIVDQKHRLTHLLFSFFEAQGLLQRRRQVKDTVFASKPMDVTGEIDFNAFDVKPIYHKLVFGPARVRLSTLGVLNDRFRKAMPSAHYRLKRLLGRAAHE